ncbi:hypothetical protein QAD02_004080 [Eretmocerus hayati]|uniref:Uncharacterized protein n=1 Tax=Eretmocerus hayati TaxID=131215 RepID=A0ACC2NNH5_9HYME|nr:hypothetical protein QAD02_004080 [Eretmocerus hayati]
MTDEPKCEETGNRDSVAHAGVPLATDDGSNAKAVPATVDSHVEWFSVTYTLRPRSFALKSEPEVPMDIKSLPLHNERKKRKKGGRRRRPRQARRRTIRRSCPRLTVRII